MMTNKSNDLSHRAEARAPSLAARLMGVVLTPHDTFAAIVKKPRPWGVLIVICLSVGDASGWLLGTDAGQQAAVAVSLYQISCSSYSSCL